MTEDKDQGINSQVTYRLESRSQYFEIDPNSGRITTKQLLDPAAVQLHRLTVIATDKGTPALSSTGKLFYTISINMRNVYIVKV